MLEGVRNQILLIKTFAVVEQDVHVDDFYIAMYLIKNPI